MNRRKSSKSPGAPNQRRESLVLILMGNALLLMLPGNFNSEFPESKAAVVKESPPIRRSS
jgi:hypothetical protein